MLSDGDKKMFTKMVKSIKPLTGFCSEELKTKAAKEILISISKEVDIDEYHKEIKEFILTI